MSAADHAKRERHELADLLDAVGPDAPTLCEGWTTRDLAAHLVVRESRPDAGIGIVLPPFAGWTRRVQDGRAREDYAVLVNTVRTGPPLLSVYALPTMDGTLNLIEYVVHHEDVIRAQPDWRARTLPDDLVRTLWARLLPIARARFRSLAYGVMLVSTDHAAKSVVHAGHPIVQVQGAVLDLLLLAYGRRAVDVELVGDDEAVASFRERYLTA